jgi:hypothetical protein
LPPSSHNFKIAFIILLLILLTYYLLLRGILSSKTHTNRLTDMPEYRYITVDGEPPCGGITPSMPLRPPSGTIPVRNNNGGYLGSGVIGVVVPRPGVGHSPNWQPWHNVPCIPTAIPATPASAVRAPVPTGGKPPTSEKPLRLPSGLGYVFPKSHTTIHVIEPGYFPWERPGGTFQWRAYKVPTLLALGEFIGQIYELSSEQKRYRRSMKNAVLKRVIECVELGDGMWGRGSEFCVGEGRGKDADMKKVVALSLEKIGWDSKRGDSSPPVWVATEVVA